MNKGRKGAIEVVLYQVPYGSYYFYFFEHHISFINHQKGMVVIFIFFYLLLDHDRSFLNIIYVYQLENGYLHSRTDYRIFPFLQQDLFTETYGHTITDKHKFYTKK